jgi:hypothetical protein
MADTRAPRHFPHRHLAGIALLRDHVQDGIEQRAPEVSVVIGLAILTHVRMLTYDYIKVKM